MRVSRLSMPQGIRNWTPLGNWTSMTGATDSVRVTGIHVTDGDAFGLATDTSLTNDGGAVVLAGGAS
jgi:hypothetical protein